MDKQFVCKCGNKFRSQWLLDKHIARTDGSAPNIRLARAGITCNHWDKSTACALYKNHPKHEDTVYIQDGNCVCARFEWISGSDNEDEDR